MFKSLKRFFVKRKEIEEINERIAVLEGILAKFNGCYPDARKIESCTVNITDLIANTERIVLNCKEEQLEKIKCGGVNIEKNSAFSRPTHWELNKEGEMEVVETMLSNDGVESKRHKLIIKENKEEEK